MSTTPAISVCMPVYNAELYLREAIESILNQTFSDFEFLILDDGSTDGTPAIVEEYAARDPRIKASRRPNGGHVTALNDLLARARGEFIARMDGDDVALPERFERQIAYLREHPDCIALGTTAQVIDPDGDPLTLWFTAKDHEEIDAQNLDMNKGAALCHPSAMMRRERVAEIGNYDAGLRLYEDRDLWLRLAERGRLAILPEPLLRYRTHPKNVSKSRSEREQADGADVIRRAYVRRGLPERDLKPLPLESSAEPSLSHASMGWMALGNGYVGTARKHARKLLAMEPLSYRSWLLLFCALRGH